MIEKTIADHELTPSEFNQMLSLARHWSIRKSTLAGLPAIERSGEVR